MWALLWFHRLLSSRAPTAMVLVRLAIGSVFLSEGLQKFLFPAELGVGRFTHIGISYPAFTAPFVGVIEITCGILMLLGFLMRLASIPLVLDMLVAIAKTKFPLLLESGFWKMAHEARIDVSIFLSSLFCLIVGAGAWSLDALLHTLLTHNRPAP